MSWFDKHRPVFQEILNHRIGVAQAENERLFELLGRIFPLRLHSFDSRAEHNGWIVPDAWHVRKAEIRQDGGVVFDGLIHPMAVIGNSMSFSGRVSKAELNKHVFFSRVQPDAYAFHCMNNYRPWAKEWGFCVPLADYQTWPDGEYDIAGFIVGGGGVDLSVSFFIVVGVATGVFTDCFFSISSDR